MKQTRRLGLIPDNQRDGRGRKHSALGDLGGDIERMLVPAA